MRGKSNGTRYNDAEIGRDLLARFPEYSLFEILINKEIASEAGSVTPYGGQEATEKCPRTALCNHLFRAVPRAYNTS